jgi:1,4-alpha-glucan branching enzyme
MRKTFMKKAYSKTGRVCRVTFAVQPEGNVQTVAVCGEFNGWDPTAHPMQRRKDGRFVLTLSLPAKQPYRFRYLLDGTRWANDPTADAYVPNPFGSEDCVIQV